MSLDLTLYRTFIEGCERRASEGVDSMVREYMAEFPDATPDEVRAFTVFAIETWLSIYGDAAADRALEMFDEVCGREGIDATSRHFDVIDRSKVEDAVHYARTFHLDKMGKDEAGYLKRCRLLMGSYVHRSAWDNTIRNCEANHVRWARVPTGTVTCGWCLILASRGFDYLSSDTARAGCHDDCDCVVVPGRRGTSIEGYDPAAYLEAYERTQRLAAEGYSQSQVRWLMAGEDPEAVGEPNGGNAGRPRDLKATDYIPVGVGAKRRTHMDRPSSKVYVTKSQFGKKAAKHAREWGLDPSSSNDRDALFDIIDGIIDNADRVSHGEWRGQPGPCTFYERDGDLVIVNALDHYVTVMRGGGSN